MAGVPRQPARQTDREGWKEGAREQVVGSYIKTKKIERSLAALLTRSHIFRDFVGPGSLKEFETVEVVHPFFVSRELTAAAAVAAAAAAPFTGERVAAICLS